MLSTLGRIAYRWYLIAILISVALVAVLTLFQPATTAIHTAGFAAQVLPSPVKFQPWITVEPERRAISFTRNDGTEGQADVYVVPDGKRRAAVLVFLGANAAGADDPDVINLGRALARTGFAVMYYWSPTMGERAHIDAGEIANLVAAFQHLRAEEYVDPQRVGLAGFSVGASFALVAAADPRIADDIAFVNAFGGYYDTADLVAQIAAAQAIDDGRTTPWDVDRLTRLVYNNMLIDSIDDPEHRKTAQAIAGGAAYDPGEWVPPSTDAAFVLLAGVDYIGMARWRYAQLTERFRAEVDSIAPSHHVDQWSGKTAMRIMHDVGDPLIRVGESRRLVGALRERRPDVEVYYTETDVFQHVRPDANRDLKSLLRGAWQLFRHMFHIVAIARQPAG